MFDFKSIKATLAALGDQVKTLELKISKKEQEVKFLQESPPSKQDLVEFLSSSIDQTGSGYQKCFERGIEFLQRRPMDKMQLPVHHSVLQAIRIVGATEGAFPASPISMEVALCALLGPEIKKAIVKHVNAMKIDNPGPALKDRPKLLEKAESELLSLRTELQSLKQEASAHSISI